MLFSRPFEIIQIVVKERERKKEMSQRGDKEKAEAMELRRRNLTAMAVIMS